MRLVGSLLAFVKTLRWWVPMLTMPLCLSSETQSPWKTCSGEIKTWGRNTILYLKTNNLETRKTLPNYPLWLLTYLEDPQAGTGKVSLRCRDVMRQCTHKTGKGNMIFRETSQFHFAGEIALVYGSGKRSGGVGWNLPRLTGVLCCQRVLLNADSALGGSRCWPLLQSGLLAGLDHTLSSGAPQSSDAWLWVCT